MQSSHRTVFFNQAEYVRAWQRRGPGNGWFQLDRVRPETLSEAAHFLAGALLREGFTLHQNGGLPLLERRKGNLLEEIVLRPAPRSSRRGLPFMPIAVQLHLSHMRLGQVRRRYWRPGIRAPLVVASGDIGQLEIPPCWVIWQLQTDRRSFSAIVEWMERLALPWFDGFHRPIELHGRLQDGCVPLVRTDTALEFILAHYGPVEASMFLERSLRNHSQLDAAVKDEMRRLRYRRVPVGFEDSVAHNLAVVASSFELLNEIEG